MARARWRRRLGPLYFFAVAVQFLTRLPAPRDLDPRPDDLARAAPWFPVVGLVVGGCLAGLAAGLAATPLVPAAGAALLLVAGVLVTGGFHEDGLADTADGIFGGFTRERRLEIMRDSRVGSYGALAICLALGVRAALLWSTAPALWGAALICAHATGRWSSLVLMKTQPYARASDPGLGKPAVAGLSRGGLIAGTAFALAIAGGVGAATGLAALAAALAVSLAAGAYFQRRIGGITGDALGAANVVCELIVLVAFAAAFPPAASPWT